jgi:UDP-N-acetylmuramyl tripeptide synthase
MRPARHTGPPTEVTEAPGDAPTARDVDVPATAARRRSGFSARTTLAVTAGAMAARLSRVARLGAGGVVGGRVALALQPEILAELARDRTVVLVTGTNGKTTTTAMLARAMGTLGTVATNGSGANMPDGLVTALAAAPEAGYGVLEIDEAHLPSVLAATAPAVLVLLNLSRDQMDRVGEVRRTERVLREALSRCPSVTVVANCDDVLVTSVAAATHNPVWVAAGASWQADSATCPRCGDLLRDRTGQWWCRCGFARPRPHWTLEPHGLRTPDGHRVPLAVGVPGSANVGNAAMAAAAAVTLGAPLMPALYGIGSVSDVAGRYRLVEHQDRRARLLLAKNPAGWRDTLKTVGQHDWPAVLAINAREADGQDPSWLWDVPFDLLTGRRIVVSGERAVDLAVRLTYAQVAHTIVADPVAAVTSLPPGPVDVIGNYTAFHDLVRRLGHA